MAKIKGVTPTGQRIAAEATTFIVVARFENDQPVLGQSVLYLPGLAPLVLLGTPDEIADGQAPAPQLPLTIVPTGTNEA